MKRKISLFLAVFGLLLTIPAYGSWDVSVSKDKMTGEQFSYATSPITLPAERMSFPYSDTKDWLGVGCDGTNEWAYVGFTGQPNLIGIDIKDGYNLIRARIKWEYSNICKNLLFLL